MRSAICIAAVLAVLVLGAEAGPLRGAITGRKLRQTVNLAYGAKWAIGAPCENYYTLRSQGGPDSSIAGTRTTDIKQGCPPAPPIFKFSYDPKRSDAGGKDGGKDAKKGGSRRRLAQILSL